MKGRFICFRNKLALLFLLITLFSFIKTCELKPKSFYFTEEELETNFKFSFTIECQFENNEKPKFFEKKTGIYCKKRGNKKYECEGKVDKIRKIKYIDTDNNLRKEIYIKKIKKKNIKKKINI